MSDNTDQDKRESDKEMIDVIVERRQTWELSAGSTVRSLQLDFSTWPTFSSPVPPLLVSSQ